MFTILLILVVCLSEIHAADYMAIAEDSFLPCTDGPPGSIPVTEAFYLDDLVVELVPEGIYVSGNATTLWNFPRTDRLQAKVSIFHHNRGTWEPTVFNVLTRDLCTAIFDKNTYWHNSWFRNLLNEEEIKEKCLTTKDTVLAYNPFLLKLRAENIIGPPLHGRYMAKIIFEAFDQNNERRPTSLCFEFRGNVQRIRK
ncbi:uncharacterized protein LOC108038481 [Drosophila rhopaloa]|uniref:Uncharacterized protein LOC108038481 n=1 Tax=Drosophila rhopaloa TaxID=1041015 RepID=A0A6P4DYG7_DRORH|nr:uncharacterized protein LOC108038481 [Drosophila rhopaloa]